MRIVLPFQAWLPILLLFPAHDQARGNVSFTFNPDPGTPQYVLDGFSMAAAQWSALLKNDITVNVDIGFQSMGPGILGSTTVNSITANYAEVRTALVASTSSADDASAYAHLQSGSTYTRLINHTSDNPNGANSGVAYVNSLQPVSVNTANAKALGLLGATSSADASIRFNSNQPFDFNPADGTTSGQYDFVTVATHELGHALGFMSVVNSIEQLGSAADQLPASVLDMFRFSAASLAVGPGVIDCTADTRDKFFSVNANSSVAAFATGATYGSGYQANHWKEFTFTGIMDPQTFAGLQRRIGTTDLRAFDAMGYALPEPGPSAVLLLGFGLALLRRNQTRSAEAESFAFMSGRWEGRHNGNPHPDPLPSDGRKRECRGLVSAGHPTDRSV